MRMNENHKKTIPNGYVGSVSPVPRWFRDQNEEIAWAIVLMVIEDYLPQRK
jgi:hypothetical protein